MANQKTNDFYAVRSRMLEKYNVGSGTSSKQSGQKSGGESPENDEFMTVRQKLLEKYSDDSAQKNRTSVSNWVTRYNSAISGFSDYENKRNGGYTHDASGGFGSEIDSLIADFDSIRGYAGRYGLPNAQQYLKQLQQLKQYIGDTNATMAQFSSEDDYNTAVRYSGYYQKYNGQTYGQLKDTLSKLEDGEEKDILTFGPLSVDPEYQRRGIGKALLRHSLEKAAQMGYEAVVIFGNPENYVTSGFRSCKHYGVAIAKDAYPVALLVRELKPGALAGKNWLFEESSAFEIDEAAAEAFDADFPPMEKAWQPSQELFAIYSRSMVVR